MISRVIRGAGSRALVGGLRGAAFGVAGGFLLGAVGHVLGDGMSTARVVTWADRSGRAKRFTDLEALESFDIYRDLMVLFEARSCDAEAFNDSCRHIQSVVFLFKRFQQAGAAGIMDARRITDKSILATKSMDALLVSCRSKSHPESDRVEESMMRIHLAFDEIIHGVRKSSEDVLPDLPGGRRPGSS